MSTSILWVEDQYDDNKTLMDALEADPRGEMTKARTVSDALDMLELRDFDVLILDLNVPLGTRLAAIGTYADGDLNGRYVVEFLETNARLVRNRVLCLTNFYERGRALLGTKVRILKKGIFISDLKQEVFGV